jgi:RimJ/RimL family protein N-acetyltransferase
MFKYEGVAIRLIEATDLEKMLQLRRSPDVWMQLGDIIMVGLEEQRRWFESLIGDKKRCYYVLCTDEIDFIGIVRTDEIDYVNRSIRVGGDILPEYQGRGYGKKMYRLLLKYCFDYLNMHRAWLLVLETNTVARNLYQKVGFSEEGRMRQAIFRNGEYQDYVMMSLLRDEWKE